MSPFYTQKGIEMSYTLSHVVSTQTKGQTKSVQQ